MSDPGEPEPTFDGGLRPVAGEWALGLRMVQRSHRPWQWGVRFLSEARPGNAAKYAGLFARDGELASAWDAWTLQGAAPYRLVLRLRELALSATDDEAEAWLDLWTELFASQTHGGALLHLKYHGLDPPPDLEVRLHTITQAILQHLSPEFLDRLAPVNPSPASPFGDAACDPDRALMFAYAWDEVLKIELWRRLGHTPLKLPPEAEPGRRARAIEAEWAHLRPFTDELYGFRVKPRLSVDDLIYYCRHGWSQLATHEMVAYLAARATALPCLPKTRKGTRRALERAFLPLLKRGTQQLAKAEGRKQPSPDDLRTVSTSMVEALREFDLWHATPSVFLPFGTAAMTAWDRRAQRGRLPKGGAIPEGYIPFTAYIETLLEEQTRRVVIGPGHGASRGKKDTSEDPQERMARHVIPEAVIAEAAWSRSSASAALSEEEQAELSDSPSLAQEVDDAVLNDLAEAQGRASERASATRPSEVTVTLAGQEVICRTLEAAAARLGVHPRTLDRHVKSGEMDFVEHKGTRYVPLDDLDAWRVLLRPNADWEKLLGVSERHVRRLKAETPGEHPRWRWNASCSRRQSTSDAAKQRLPPVANDPHRRSSRSLSPILSPFSVYAERAHGAPRR